MKATTGGTSAVGEAGRWSSPRPLAILLGLAIAGFVLTAACDGPDDLFDDGVATVGPSDSQDFPSIQAALDIAPAGARIEVVPGTYVAEIDIDRPVTLVCPAGGCTILLPSMARPSSDGGPQPVIDVEDTTDVTVEGFAVVGPGDGIVVRGSDRVRLVNIVASGNGDEGIDVRASSDVEVSGTFSDNADDGVQIQSGSAAVTVHSSVVTDNGQDGIKLESTSGCVVRDNVVSGNGDDGILIGESSTAQVLGNEVTTNVGAGIHIRNSPDTVFLNNVVSGNAGGNIDLD